MCVNVRLNCSVALAAYACGAGTEAGLSRSVRQKGLASRLSPRDVLLFHKPALGRLKLVTLIVALELVVEDDAPNPIALAAETFLGRW